MKEQTERHDKEILKERDIRQRKIVIETAKKTKEDKAKSSSAVEKKDMSDSSKDSLLLNSYLKLRKNNIRRNKKKLKKFGFKQLIGR